MAEVGVPKNPLLERLFERLANKEGVHFKHQTRDEPDLTVVEKCDIARQIYEKSPGNFLSRYHQYLTEDDSVCFEAYKDDYEVAFYLKEIAKRNVGRTLKNRRYVAMGRMMKDGDYFSESEMKERDPALYHELIGRYNGSDDESPSKKCRTFSEFLLASLDSRDNAMDSRPDDKSEDEDIEEFDTDEEEDDGDVDMSEDESDDDAESRPEADGDKQSEGFDPHMDENSQLSEGACGGIDESQRELYRQEFLSVMQGRFLRGEDEHFDYEALNADLSLDDQDEKDRDAEEQYFDEEDPQTPCTLSSASSNDFPDRLTTGRSDEPPPASSAMSEEAEVTAKEPESSDQCISDQNGHQTT